MTRESEKIVERIKGLLYVSNATNWRFLAVEADKLAGQLVEEDAKAVAGLVLGDFILFKEG